VAAPAINLTPLAPGRQVAVLPSGEASGATIGYYGTVLSVFYGTVRANPRTPDLWRYRIYVYALKCECEVLGRDLVAFGSSIDDADGNSLALCSSASDAERDGVLGLAVRFETTPAEDNEELRGAYRPPEGAWGSFKFKKRPQPFPTYRYRAPVCGRTDIAEGEVSYKVPAVDRLDRAYVVTALAVILGTAGPVDCVDPDSPQ
jgi:hypothetical protein